MVVRAVWWLEVTLKGILGHTDYTNIFWLENPIQSIYPIRYKQTGQCFPQFRQDKEPAKNRKYHHRHHHRQYQKREQGKFMCFVLAWLWAAGDCFVFIIISDGGWCSARCWPSHIQGRSSQQTIGTPGSCLMWWCEANDIIQWWCLFNIITWLIRDEILTI